MSKWVDENNIWWHTNDAGETKKLLLNPETKQPYKQGQIIHLNGKKFKIIKQLNTIACFVMVHSWGLC